MHRPSSDTLALTQSRAVYVHRTLAPASVVVRSRKVPSFPS